MIRNEAGASAPNEGVVPCELNTPLFSDYAVKYRTVWMPPNTAAAWNDVDALDFPVGTIVTKSFGFRDDLRKATPSIKWIETRVFVRQTVGWKGVSYAWNAAQTSASVNYGGGGVAVSRIDDAGVTVHDEDVGPHGNQCTERPSHRPAGPSPAVTHPLRAKARNPNPTH